MNAPFRYNNRYHAGKVLAQFLVDKVGSDPLILALPRGGVPVAFEVAKLLNVSFDVLNVRKIGAPFNSEYGIGAICEDLKPVFNAGELMPLENIQDEVKAIVEVEREELRRRIKLYRGGRSLPSFKNREVLLIDDGLATGVSAAAAGQFLKSRGARKVILAVPVGPDNESEFMRKSIDELLCPYRLALFSSISLWYKEFKQVSDGEVLSCLRHYHPDLENNISL